MSLLKSKKGKIAIVVVILLVIIYLVGLKSHGEKAPISIENEKVPSFMKGGTSSITNPPVYTRVKELRDPFKDMEMNVWKLNNLLLLKKKEVELLKATLEESKLRKAIKELGGTVHGSGLLQEIGTSSAQAEVGPKLLAVVISEGVKKALITIGSDTAWIEEGQQFRGLRVVKIDDQGVLVTYKGKKKLLKQGEE